MRQARVTKPGRSRPYVPGGQGDGGSFPAKRWYVRFSIVGDSGGATDRLEVWAGSGFYDGDKSVQFLSVSAAGGANHYQRLGRKRGNWDSDGVALLPDEQPKLVSGFSRSA